MATVTADKLARRSDESLERAVRRCRHLIAATGAVMLGDDAGPAEYQAFGVCLEAMRRLALLEAELQRRREVPA